MARCLCVWLKPNVGVVGEAGVVDAVGVVGVVGVAVVAGEVGWDGKLPGVAVAFEGRALVGE